MRLVVAAGGTGGHIYPALAVAEAALSRAAAEAILFVGARRGLEGTLVPAHGFDIRLLPLERVRGMGIVRGARGLAGLGVSLPIAAHILREFRADAVLGLGGYASAPAMIAGAALGLRTVLCEQNTIPGTTNRVLAKMADNVCVSYSMSSAYFPAWKVVLTGNPVRAEVAAVRGRRASGRKEFRLLVLGGSQGAQFLNTAVAGALADFVHRRPDVTVVHQSGEGRRAEAEAAYAGAPRVDVVEYVEDMAGLLEQASLVVGRAGATTLAELSAVGVPALLVPFPFATDNHQLFNAREMERAGAAVVFEQASFNEDRLVDELERLRKDRAALEAMERASASMCIKDAATRVLDVARGRA